MSRVGEDPDIVLTRPRRAIRAAMASGFPPRPTPLSWPATTLAGEEVMKLLSSGRFFADRTEERRRRGIAVELLLEWLSVRPGATWQDRWSSVEAEVTGTAWRRERIAWLTKRGQPVSWLKDVMAVALRMTVAADIVRPSLGWLLSGAMGNGALARALTAYRDPDGFARIGGHCAADAEVSARAATHTFYRCALIMAAKGGGLADICVGDMLELFDAEGDTPGGLSGGAPLFYRVLRGTGVLGEAAPPTFRHLRTVGQRSPGQMIDRYHLACRPVRDLLVEYLTERRPALDYNTLETLANLLGNRFWADIEAHHPGVDSLRLPAEVANAWKQRLRTKSTKQATDAGGTTEIVVERLSYRECLTPVRAFYLDLAQWAIEDPGRWGRWACPSPVGPDEGVRRKFTRQRKSRMDQRTRAQLPALPALVRAVDQHRKATAALLETGRAAEPGDTFSVAGVAYLRRARADGIWVEDRSTGKRRDLVIEHRNAFWAWAVIEVLRHTGIRVEELLELSHHSLVQYRLPGTGELIPLLQITPSKTDAERLLVVSPELAEVLSAIILATRDHRGAVPLVSAYDDYERVWLPPSPRLFQRRVNGEDRAFAHSTLLKILTAVAARTGLVDPVEGHPLHYTPHDFRRMFITDAILNGLPPHIAQVIVGHQDINVTLGYKAVYPHEAIQAHLAYLARRRALRPSDEYRVPTDTEWDEFLGHFERRKVSVGTCARAFATPCIHEHACVRCPMLWPDPAAQGRITEIRDNLTARIAEAKREGWLGEEEGLQISLAGANDKLAQIDRHNRTQAVTICHQPPARSRRP